MVGREKAARLANAYQFIMAPHFYKCSTTVRENNKNVPLPPCTHHYSHGETLVNLKLQIHSYNFYLNTEKSFTSRDK